MTEQNGAANGAPETPQSTFTQADVDRIVADRLGRERGKYADYDQLKAKAGEFDKLAEAQKTEQQKLAEQLATAQAEVTAARTEALRLKVATAKGLPSALAARLHGASEEEMTADADALLAALGPARTADPRRPVESLKPGALPAGEPASVDMNQRMRQQATRT